MYVINITPYVHMPTSQQFSRPLFEIPKDALMIVHLVAIWHDTRPLAGLMYYVVKSALICVFMTS
jgi:hypothetical protein